MTWVTHSLKTSGRSNDSVTRSLKTSGRSNGLVIPIIASLWIFCRMTWKMSYAEFHLFEPSSQCFQHLFDFILHNFISFKLLFHPSKTTLVHKQLWYTSFLALTIPNRMKKLSLRYPMYTKCFKRNPNTFALRMFTLKTKYFFANDLFYIKKYGKSIKPMGNSHYG